MTTSQITEQVTNATAIGGVTIPFWYQYMEQISSLAAQSMPLFGVVWLIIQIAYRLKNWDDKKEDK